MQAGMTTDRSTGPCVAEAIAETVLLIVTAKI